MTTLEKLLSIVATVATVATVVLGYLTFYRDGDKKDIEKERLTLLLETRKNQIISSFDAIISSSTDSLTSSNISVKKKKVIRIKIKKLEALRTYLLSKHSECVKFLNDGNLVAFHNSNNHINYTILMAKEIRSTLMDSEGYAAGSFYRGKNYYSFIDSNITSLRPDSLTRLFYDSFTINKFDPIIDTINQKISKADNFGEIFNEISIGEFHSRGASQDRYSVIMANINEPYIMELLMTHEMMHNTDDKIKIRKYNCDNSYYEEAIAYLYEMDIYLRFIESTAEDDKINIVRIKDQTIDIMNLLCLSVSTDGIYDFYINENPDFSGRPIKAISKGNSKLNYLKMVRRFNHFIGSESSDGNLLLQGWCKSLGLQSKYYHFDSATFNLIFDQFFQKRNVYVVRKLLYGY